MSYLEDLREKGRDANPFFKLMEIEVATFGDGKAELQMVVRPDILNGAGWMQGGIYTALADEAMALALFTALDESDMIATISETTSFFRGVREGRIVAEGRVTRIGRQVAFAEGWVVAEGADGPVLSQTSASFSIIREK
ncbi:MAG TPA: PaaI family thioesterase [Methanothrix sp.]|nr:PaaI family thioesterase [Methanothrix sp.]HPJ84701.1 PaaI family thioesterase [Methanothrix sp.]HPR66244.1 PaaI family thioesterase [Methanothrix sp.]